ncbi:MAG: nucleotidyltransferase domain-containing protein [Spirochaetes bacterium]|nr:nucleotidyltransferase domain-containing protein [Spirochaetota bacterium]
MNNKELLEKINRMIKQNFDDLIEKAILFGSRVDGTATEYSDYDILIVTKKKIDWKVEEQIRSILYTLNIDYDIILSVQFISIADLHTIKGKQPFILQAFETGVEIR